MKKTWKAALYARLSRDDDNYGEPPCQLPIRLIL